MNALPNREVEIFCAARQLHAEARAAYLREACEGNPALRQRVERLLRANEEAGGFLQEPAPGAQRLEVALVSSTAPGNAAATGEKVGDNIGSYKLLEQIGQGGCGVVYMAEQETPVRRKVALKVIKLGMDTRQVVARFEAERQALALMDHPNIAKVLDAGTTNSGRPYFAMDLVRGIKITEYCDENELSTRERLDLFIQVCQAIQHAHQKGIIHRDIKPSNILVTVNQPGAPGCPKVIDFGIAKATQGRLTDQTLFTAFEQFIGTPAYMSPEQAMMTNLDIDTRTDIYSLGVLLYELLTGRPPFDSKDLLAAGLDEMRRTIREVEPLKPSTRLTKERLAARSAGSAKSKVQRLKSEIDKDLDWIVMKCLEKDRARRYATANGLARDLQRYLSDEPVVARPPSKLYRFQKLVRRNKLGFAAGAGVFAALIAGLALSNWFFLREKAARRRAVAAEQEKALSLKQAQASAKQAQDINRFVRDALLFKATPELNSRGKKITMEEGLEQATGLLDIDAAIAKQPELEGTLRLDFGTAYETLGALPEAGRNLRRAFELRRTALGPTNLDTLAAEYQLANFLLFEVRQFVEPETLFKEVWRGRQELLGSEHRETVDALEGYEVVLFETDRIVEAERIARQILPIRERDLGVNSFAAISALLNLSGPVGMLGDHAGAARLCREALSRCQREGVVNSRPCFFVVKELANQRLLQSDPEEAEKLLNNAVPVAVGQFGADHPVTLWMQRVRARALAEEGRFAEAEALARTTLSARLGKTSDLQGTGRTLLVLGSVLVQQGKLDEAEIRLQEALPLIRDSVVRKEALAVQVSNWLGAIQVARQAYPRAESLLLPGSEKFFTPAAQMSPNELRIAVGHIVALYQAWGKPEQEAEWRQKLDSIPDVAAARSLRILPTPNAKPAEVEKQYREVLAAKRAVLGSDNSTVIATVCNLGAFLKSQGRPGDAARIYRESLGLGLNPRAEDLVKLPAIMGKLAEELDSRSEREEADKLYEEAIESARHTLGESHPVLDTLRDRFSDLLASEGRFDAAANQFLQAVQIRRAKPGYGLVESLYYLSWLQIKAGKPRDAELTLREALEVFRSGRWKENYNGEICVTVRLADALLQQHKLAEAEQYCQEAVATSSRYQGNKIDHFYHQSVFWLLRVLKAENKLGAAQSVLDQMLARERRVTVAVGLLAEAAFDTYKNCEDDPETRAFFLRRGSEILREVPADDVFKAAGVVFGLLYRGYKEQATNICWRILETSATDGPWFNSAAWYFATAESPSSRDPGLAVALAKRAVELGGSDKEFGLNTLGVARYRAGDFRQALADLEKCESVSVPPNPGTSFNCFFMAMAHHQLGNDDTARRCYNQAIKWMKEHGPQNPELIRFRAEAEALLGPMVQAKTENESPAPSVVK